MTAIDKIKHGFWSQIGTALALGVVALLSWIFWQVAPPVWSAMKDVADTRAFLAALLLSLLLNMVLFWSLWSLSRLNWKDGMLWDRKGNPYCPACRSGAVRWDDFEDAGKGYLCQVCDKLFTYPEPDRSVKKT